MTIVVVSSLLLSPVMAGVATDKAAPQMPVIQDLDWRVQNLSNLHCNITNFGLIGATPGSGAPYQGAPSAEWPAFSGVDYMWSSGPWIGALKNGQPAVSTAAYALEFRPGRTSTDAMYESQEGVASGRRVPDPMADDDQDGRTDEDPLDGYDNDHDGKIDEDYAAISDQMLTARFNDYDPDIQQFWPDHEPLGIDVTQTTMAWLPQAHENFIGIEYKIVNSGVDTLQNLYVGMFADFDIGRRARGPVGNDDQSGFWEGMVTPTFPTDVDQVPVSLAYMFDNNGDNGESEGYIAYQFLGVDDPHADENAAPVKLRNYRAFTGSTPYEFGGLPVHDWQQYAVLNGSAPFSLAAPSSDSDRPPSNTAVGDFRQVASVGPFSLVAPGDTVCVSLALVIGAGFDGLLQTAAATQLLYDGLTFDCDDDPQTGTDGRECHAPWSFDPTTPIELQSFAVATDGDAARLDWRFDAAAVRELRGVHVQRAPQQDGPFTTLARGLLPTQTMQWRDDPIDGSAWYRLLLELHDGTLEPTRSVQWMAAASRTESSLAVESSPEDSRVQVRYRIARSGPVGLTVYDVRGSRLRVLEESSLRAGEYLHQWDRRDAAGRTVAPGIYFLQLRTPESRLVRKLVLAR